MGVACRIKDGGEGLRRTADALRRILRTRARSVDFDSCPNQRTNGRGTTWCACKPVCAVCGFRKHTAVHGPRYGQSAPESPPYDHEYQPLFAARTPTESEEG